MITRFKIFENKKTYEDTSDLGMLFSEKYINEYYKDRYEIQISDIVEHTNFWPYVDEHKLKDGVIEDLVNETPVGDEEFKKEDYITFIEDNMMGSIKNEIEKWKDFYEEYPEDDKDVLQHVNKIELEHLIQDKEKGIEFKTDYFEEKYFNIDVRDILEDIHGKDKVEVDLYDIIGHHIDDNEVIDDYIDNVPFDDKWDYFIEDIPYSSILQKELLKMDERTVLGLYNVLEDDDSNCDIGCTYEFQKLYIKVRCDDSNEKDEYVIPEAIKELNDKFNLTDKIKEEYSEHMFMIDSEKFKI